MDSSTAPEPKASKRVRVDIIMAAAIISIGLLVEGVRQIVAITS